MSRAHGTAKSSLKVPCRHSRLARPALRARLTVRRRAGPAGHPGALGARQRAGRPRAVHGRRRAAAHHRPEAGGGGPGRHAPLRPAAGGRGRRGPRVRRRRQLRDVPAALSRRAEERRSAAAGGAAPHPFIAISKAVSAAIAADQYRAVTAGFEAQRELTRAALAPTGRRRCSPGSPRTSTAGPRSTTPRARWSPRPRPGPCRRAARFIGHADGCVTRPAPASAVVGGDDAATTASSSSRSAAAAAPAVLAVGTGAPLGTAERYAVHSAIALLDPHHRTLPRPAGGRAAPRRSGAADAAGRRAGPRPRRRRSPSTAGCWTRRSGCSRRARSPPSDAPVRRPPHEQRGPLAASSPTPRTPPRASTGEAVSPSPSTGAG